MLFSITLQLRILGAAFKIYIRLAFLNNVNLHATELKMKDNYSSGPLFRLENNSEMTVVNSVFDDGLGLVGVNTLFG
jgi:hypothetical protein